MILSKAEQKIAAEQHLEATVAAQKFFAENFPKNDTILEKVAIKLSETSFWLGAYINKLNKENV